MNRTPDSELYKPIGRMTVEEAVDENIAYQSEIATMFGFPETRVQRLREAGLTEWSKILTHAIVSPPTRIAEMSSLSKRTYIVDACRQDVFARLCEVQDLCLRLSAKRQIQYSPNMNFVPNKELNRNEVLIGQMPVKDAITENVRYQRTLAAACDYPAEGVRPLIRRTLDDWYAIMNHSILSPIANIPQMARGKTSTATTMPENDTETLTMSRRRIATMRYLVAETLSGIRARLDEINHTCADVAFENNLIYIPSVPESMEPMLDLFRVDHADRQMYNN